MALQHLLSEAARDGKLAQCEALILKNADVNWKNPDAVVHKLCNIAILP